MKSHRIKHIDGTMKLSSILLAAVMATLSLGTPLQADELPAELPLWEKGSPAHAFERDDEEQVRSHKAQPGSLPGLNRAFSAVSSPTYSIHRPEKPNGMGLVICPGGGFRDVWLDREGHDLAIWLKEHNVTSLHVFSKGGHGFGLGDGRGESTALWPTSFVAWLRDCGVIED